jgi:hypothetical protein
MPLYGCTRSVLEYLSADLERYSYSSTEHSKSLPTAVVWTIRICMVAVASHTFSSFRQQGALEYIYNTCTDLYIEIQQL